jgi:hypothetical protein
MKHFSEEDLIAYQLHESREVDAIRNHLELCSDCSALSDSIAETLRVFSADPVPQPNLDHAWARLRASLPALTPAPRRFAWFKLSPFAGLATAALLLFGVLIFHFSHIRLHSVRPVNTAINGHGPLTTQPADPAIANHLDAAERLLTEVNHSDAPLDDETRTQAHQLLLKNAVYVSTARAQGDLAEAAVLDNLGRVLTTIDHSSEPHHSTLQLRLEMNTDGLLLDIRILRQNDDRQ